jgi:hypothetical protein
MSALRSQPTAPWRACACWLLAAVLILPTVSWSTRGPLPDWYYYSQRVVQPLTLFTEAIILYDPTPPPSSQAGARGIVAEKGLPLASMGGNWFYVDLIGSPSSGDPVAIANLVENIAADPSDDRFATPVFGTPGFSKAVAPWANVGFHEDATPEEIEAALLSVGLGPIVKTYTLRPNMFRVEGGSRSGPSVLAATNALALLPNVEFATIDWLMFGEDMADVRTEYPPVPYGAVGGFTEDQSLAVESKAACVPLFDPDDSLYGESWALEQPSSDIDLDAEAAWATCSGDNELIAAIFDDGVDPAHPDLSPNLLVGADFTDVCESPPCAGAPQVACDNHGTAVAGALAAASNAVGTLGMAPNVKILSVRTARQWSFSDKCYPLSYPSWVLAGAEFAIASGVSVINISWNYGIDPHDDLLSAFAATYDAGIVTVNSTGNRNESVVHYPGPLAEVLAVSAINSLGERMYVDEGYASNYGDAVAFCAPGQEIVTTDRTDGEGYAGGSDPHGDNYASQTGTSYASPFAAAIACLIRLINPALNPEGVGFVLARSAVDLGVPGWDPVFGNGLLNADKALELAPKVIFVSNSETGRLSGAGWSEVVGSLNGDKI